MSEKSSTFVKPKKKKSNQKIKKMKTNETSSTKVLKASKKMERTIEQLEKRFGKLNRDYFVEKRDCNRNNRGFYDGCTLTCSILKGLHIVVAHDGSYYKI